MYDGKVSDNFVKLVGVDIESLKKKFISSNLNHKLATLVNVKVPPDITVISEYNIFCFNTKLK